jgi:hypothetical protein
MRRSLVICLLLGAATVVAVAGCGVPKTSEQPAQQALRACVDRWNQADMLGWGPALARVSVRRLDAARLAELGLQDPALSRCVVSLAHEWRRDPHTGCSGYAAVSRDPGFCVDRSSSWSCAINSLGAYVCPLPHEPPRIPLRDANATIDKHGSLRLDVPLEGTRATPVLAWQRHPHTDGWIEPWTSSGTLRPGLRLIEHAYRGGGPCFAPSEFSDAKSAVRCVWRGVDTVDPCFPQTADWNHRGAVAACSGRPGDTTFLRFVTRRS